MAQDTLPQDDFEEGLSEGQESFDDPSSGSSEESSEALQAYLRDLSEDDVYNRLTQVNEFPNHLQALESRLTGNFGEFSNRLQGLEKSLPTQSAFDSEGIKKVLEEYDPKLAELLVPALAQALKTSPLDENTLRPHLEPVQQAMQGWMGEQLVLSAYPPEALAEIIPPVKDGKFEPQGQRHKDFVDWYSQQGYQTQQSLLSFGAPYIHALRKFESWEQTRNQDRTKAAEGKTQRLAGGQMPTSQNRRVQSGGPKTAEEAFLAAFQEASSELGR